MRINVRSEGPELTPQLRQVAVSRLLSALGPFGAHIASVGVRLQTSTPRTQLCCGCDTRELDRLGGRDDDRCHPLR